MNAERPDAPPATRRPHRSRPLPRPPAGPAVTGSPPLLPRAVAAAVLVAAFSALLAGCGREAIEVAVRKRPVTHLRPIQSGQLVEIGYGELLAIHLGNARELSDWRLVRRPEPRILVHLGGREEPRRAGGGKEPVHYFKAVGVGTTSLELRTVERPREAAAEGEEAARTPREPRSFFVTVYTYY